MIERPRTSDELFNPTNRPWASYRGPPENPGYITVSVCRYRSTGPPAEVREAVRKCVALLEGASYHGIVDQRTAPTDADLASDESLDDWMQRHVSASFHISGTCKMGVGSDPLAVVDQYLNVRDVEGLRVADASVMPDVTRANTNVTTMTIAERAAEFIRDGR